MAIANIETNLYDVSVLNQYTATSYDSNGNLLSDGTWTYIWNAENRLTIVSNATTVIENAYDYMGRRFRKQVYSYDSESWMLTSASSYLYDGWNLIREGSDTNRIAYLWGLDLSGSLQGAGGGGGLISQTKYGVMDTSANWALARLESLFDQAESARRYRLFFEEDSIPVRFRLQAQLLWCQALIAAGEPGPLLEARSLMETTLGNVKDPDVLMNFARQLQFGPPDLREWGAQLFEQGSALALNQFLEATVPALAMNRLFKLTRRQVRDFGRNQDVIALWEELPLNKKDWLWSESSDFWEYLSLVFTAYVRGGNMTEAEAFAKEFLEDPASPPEQLPLLGVPLARRFRSTGRFDEGIDLYARMAHLVPTHASCAEAWYWMALVAYKQSDGRKVNEYATNIRLAQGVQVGMMEQWNFDARALLLLANLNVAGVDTQAVNYTHDFLNMQYRIIVRDMESLPNAPVL